MGMKLTEDRFDFDLFEPMPDDWYVLRIKKAEASLVDSGLKAKVEAEVETGEHQGRKHFENFSTRKQDGMENSMGCQMLLAFLLKAGIAKAGQFTDSSQFETEKFAAAFQKLATEKLYGAYLSVNKYTDKNGKERANNKTQKFRTVAEAQAEQKKVPPAPNGKTAAGGDWD